MGPQESLTPTTPSTTPAPPSALRKTPKRRLPYREASTRHRFKGKEREAAGNLLAEPTHWTSTDCHRYNVFETLVKNMETEMINVTKKPRKKKTKELHNKIDISLRRSKLTKD